MRTFNFTEMPYPYLPPEDEYESLRVNLPNGLYDPKIGASLYNRYLDEHVACDELGLNIFVNEHHQTPTCLQSAGPIHLGILARQTERARLLILGNPIVTRRDPVRIAEEMAVVDNISYGRLECGLIRGVPYEIAAANVPAVNMHERMWEAHDLIVKAFTTHDGPFNWEGKYFHYRHVNIWPRPYQQPHPPIWVTTLGSAAKEIAGRGHVVATMFGGLEGTKTTFDAYRAGAVEAGHFPAPEQVPSDRFAMLVFLAVGDTDDAGRQLGEKVAWYLRTNKSQPQWNSPPGYISAEATAEMTKAFARGGSPSILGYDPFSASVDELIDRGVFLAGDPDTVYDQIKRLYDHVGGFQNLLVMTHAGPMEHDETIASIERFAKEVQPRLDEL